MAKWHDEIFFMCSLFYRSIWQTNSINLFIHRSSFFNDFNPIKIQPINYPVYWNSCIHIQCVAIAMQRSHRFCLRVAPWCQYTAACCWCQYNKGSCSFFFLSSSHFWTTSIALKCTTILESIRTRSHIIVVFALSFLLLFFQLACQFLLPKY